MLWSARMVRWLANNPRQVPRLPLDLRDLKVIFLREVKMHSGPGIEDGFILRFVSSLIQLHLHIVHKYYAIHYRSKVFSYDDPKKVYF